MAFESDFETGLVQDIDAQTPTYATGPEDVEAPFMDFRTGHIWGQFSEEEVQEDMANIASLGTVFGLPPSAVPAAEPVLNNELVQDPELSQDVANLAELGKAKAQIQYNGTQASFAYNKYIESRDPSYLVEAQKAEAKSEELFNKYPELQDANFFKGIALESSGLVGQMGAQANDAWKAKNPFAVITQPFDMMQGEIYGSGVGLVDEESGLAIDEEHLINAANKYGRISGVSEYAGIIGLLTPVGRGAQGVSKLTKTFQKLMKNTGGLAGESLTEGFQTMMNNIAIHEAMNNTLMDNGLPARPMTEEQLMEGVNEAAKAGLQGAIGIKGAQVTVGGTRAGYQKFSKSTQDNMEQQEAERTIEVTTAAEQAAKEADVEVKQEEAATRHEPKIGDNPVTPEQRVEAHADNVVDRDGTTDAELDDLIIADEETQAAMIDGLSERTEAGITPIETEFASDLRDVLPEAEATAIEDIMAARANTARMSLGQYLHERGISIRKEQGRIGREGESASVTFTQEGQTIIRAFESADVSSVIHEVGHIFRRDIPVNDLKILEQELGVVDGAWTRANEESFTQQWEAYISTGQAPTQQLQAVFNRFSQWMKNIYRKVRNAPTEINVNDNVKGVFDRLLAGDQQMKMELEDIKADQTFFQMKAQEQLDQVEKAFKGVEDAKTRRTSTKARLRKQKKAAREKAVKDISNILGMSKDAILALNPTELYKTQLRALAKNARDMLDAGDKIGYQKAKADMKVVMATQRANRVLKARVSDTSKRTQKYLNSLRPLPKGKARKGRVSRKPRSKFNKRTNDFLTGLHKEVRRINKLGQGDLEASVMAAVMEDPDGFGLVDGKAFKNFDTVAEDVRFWANNYMQAKKNATTPEGSKAFEELFRELKNFIHTERSQSPAVIAKAKAKALVEEQGGISDITGGTAEQIAAELEGTTPNKAFKRDKLDQLKSFKFGQLIGHNTLGKYMVFGWNGLTKMITSYAPPGTQSALRQAFDFFDVRQQRNTWIREDKEAMLTNYMEQYGYQDSQLGRAKAQSKISRDARENIVVPGQKDMFSISGLRDLYMKSLDPTLEAQLTAQGLTPEVITQAIADNLTDADIAFADWQMQFYAERYERYNQPYTNLNGVNLPKHENYSPLKIEGYRDIAYIDEGGMFTGQMGIDQAIRSPEQAGSLIGRTAADIRRGKVQFNDVASFMGYVDEMNHFAAYAEQVRDVRAVFNEKLFQDGVKLRYGSKMLPIMEKMLNDISSNGKNNANMIPAIDKVRTAFVTNMVALNLGASMKQFISVTQFYQNLDMRDYGAAMVEFAKNPKAAIQDMWDMGKNSDYFQNRRTSIDRDLKAAAVTGEFRRLALNPTIHNMLSAPIRISDSAAIAIGGWAMVKKFQRQGMSRDEAIHEMTRQAEQTQQSGALEERSALQRGGSFQQLATPFSSGPVQAMRQEMEAVREFAANPRSAKAFGQMVKTLAIYHIVVPAMFKVAADWLSQAPGEEWDWDAYFENILPTLIAGPFGASYEFGRMMLNQLKRVMGHQYYQDEGMIQSLIYDAGGVLKKIGEDGVDSLDAGDILDAINVVNISAGGKVPVKRIGRAALNVAEGDVKGTFFGLNPDR